MPPLVASIFSCPALRPPPAARRDERKFIASRHDELARGVPRYPLGPPLWLFGPRKRLHVRRQPLQFEALR